MRTDFFTSVSGLSETEGTGIITSSSEEPNIRLPYFSFIVSDASSEVHSPILISLVTF